MSDTSNIVKRSPLPTPAEEDLARHHDFLTQLSAYDTMTKDISGNILTMLKKKKEEEILNYIKTFHSRKVSCVGGKGRFAGYWQTYVGKGREDTQIRRAKTLEDLLRMLAEYYGFQPELPGKRKSVTLEEYFPHWLEWKGKRNNNKASTLKHNEIDFEKYVKGTALGKMPLTSITPEDLDNWARDLLIRKPLNASRFNTYKIVVKGPLELAVREKIIPASPWRPEFMDYKVLLKSKRRAPSKEKIFFDDEIRQIVSACSESYRTTRNSCNIAVIINFDLGLRVSELSALKWSDIDWKNNTIFIQRQESEHEVENYVKSDSACGYRELPLNQNVIKLLKQLRKDFGLVSEYIFSDKNGKRKTSKSIQQRLIYAQVGKGGDKGGSGVKRIHCQRRTVATKIAKECGLEAARQWLGHTDLMTTLRYIYTTETLDSLRQYSESASAIGSGTLEALPLTADIN